MGEAEQLGCGQVLREGISPPAAEAEVFALGGWGWGGAGRGVRGCDCWLHPATRPQTAHPRGQLGTKPSPRLAPGVGSS